MENEDTEHELLKRIEQDYGLEYTDIVLDDSEDVIYAATKYLLANDEKVYGANFNLGHIDIHGKIGAEFTRHIERNGWKIVAVHSNVEPHFTRVWFREVDQ